MLDSLNFIVHFYPIYLKKKLKSVYFRRYTLEDQWVHGFRSSPPVPFLAQEGLGLIKIFKSIDLILIETHFSIWKRSLMYVTPEDDDEDQGHLPEIWSVKETRKQPAASSSNSRSRGEAEFLSWSKGEAMRSQIQLLYLGIFNLW